MDLNIIDELLKDYEWAGDTADPSHGKIYKLTNVKTDAVYIGSTCQTLEDRFRQHCIKYYKWAKMKGKKKREYKGLISYKVFKDGFTSITLVEDYPCNSILELRKREGKAIRDHTSTVNKKIAGRTKKEWEDERKQGEIDAVKERSIPKPEGHKETTIQDLMKDLDMMSAF
jgi:hypothetical protein